MKTRLILSVDDFEDGEVRTLLEAATELAQGRAPVARAPFSLGLLFLAPSLRTRIGFAAAAVRLGGTPIDVLEPRSGPGMSRPETFADTLRVVGGMTDLVVFRTSFRVERDVAEECPTNCVNGGDGEDGSHPTQALIDLLAIERRLGPVAELRVGVCGDLTARSARSLLDLLRRVPPKELKLIAPPGRSAPSLALGAELERRTIRLDGAEFDGLDVLYMAGLAEGDGERRLDRSTRAKFALTEERLGRLRQDALILAPMPVIDELDAAARADHRLGMFEQSDGGLYLRMALLERFTDSC